MTTRKSTSAKTSTKNQASARKTKKTKAKITSDDIRRRAAEIYHQRMQHGFKGDELSDWLQAEKELNGTR